MATMIRFLCFFMVSAVLGLAALDSAALQPAIGQFCLMLAKISAFIIQLFDASMTLTGAVMRHRQHGFAMEVANSCSALPVTWLLFSGMLAFPGVAWRYKWLGMAAAALGVQILNLVRLISLFYFGVWLESGYFDLVHQYVWPVVLHVGVLAFFSLWCWRFLKSVPRVTSPELLR
ncbi:MAG: exosortase H [Gammaproteobacteria bacterium]